MLAGTHFQNAYVCDDIEAAIAVFRRRAAIGDVRIWDVEQLVQTPAGDRSISMRVAYIWLNGFQYELIQPVKDIGIYINAPDTGAPIRFHHICTRVDDWGAFRAHIDTQNLPIAMEKSSGEASKFLYLDARKDLGHYLEFIWMTDESWTTFRGM